MLRRFRFVLRPGWLAGHLIVVVLAVTMVLLGRWQLHVSESKNFSLQNFGYSLQWWAFSLFGVLMWLRILRDHARGGETPGDALPSEPARAGPEPVAYRRYVMPSIPAVSNDPVHTAYNDYLAGLAAKDAEAAQ